MKLECDIIQDLLPSYSDKISSKATNKLVEEHLKQCENCKNVLKNMNKEVDVSCLEQDEKIDYLKGYNKRKKTVVVLSTLLTIIILLFIYAFNIVNKNILRD